MTILSAIPSRLDPSYCDEPQPNIFDEPLPLPDYSSVPDPDCDFRPDADWHMPGETHDPSEDDARWLAESNTGGCPPDELSPDEQAMYAGTLSAFDYWSEYLDPEGPR